LVLLITGIAMARDYHGFLVSCAAAHSCGSATFRGAGGYINLLVYGTMVVPLLFGLFWGAPLLAREFEDGTHNLAWTQGVTRRRWLIRTVMWALLAAAVWAGAMAALVSWWRLPDNALAIPYSRFGPGLFDIQGIVPVAYSVFAVALGIAAGSVLRRVVPAIATTFAIFIAARVAVVYLRPHYMPPIARLFSFVQGPDAAPAGSWVVRSNAIIGPNGQNYGSISFPSSDQVPAACRASMSASCLGSHGFRTMITYQPASRFWAFQGIEAGIFIVLAAALVALACRMVLTRDA
jgi:hypothetical protein